MGQAHQHASPCPTQPVSPITPTAAAFAYPGLTLRSGKYRKYLKIRFLPRRKQRLLPSLQVVRQTLEFYVIFDALASVNGLHVSENPYVIVLQ
jgi:hypothetical protein